MPQLLLDVNRTHPVADKLTGKGVTRVVQLHVPDPRLYQYPLEYAPYVVLFHRHPVPVKNRFSDILSLPVSQGLLLPLPV